MAFTQLIQFIFLVSSAMLGGLGVTISYVIVPILLATSDPLPSLNIFGERAKFMTVISVIVSATAGFFLFLLIGDLRYLLATVVNLLVFPWTFKFLVPVNTIILGLNKDKPGDSEKAHGLIPTWATRQLGRMSLGLTGFLIAAYTFVFP